MQLYYCAFLLDDYNWPGVVRKDRDGFTQISVVPCGRLHPAVEVAHQQDDGHRQQSERAGRRGLFFPIPIHMIFTSKFIMG